MFSFLSFFKSRKSKPDTAPETAPEAIAEPPAPIRMEPEAEPDTAPKSQELSTIYLDGYKSPSGGYMNYAEWNVSGYIWNAKTNRKNIIHKKIKAKTEQEAVEKSAEFNIIDGLSISAIPVEPPTEPQLAYAASLGAVVPPDAGKWDVSAIISRYVGPAGERCADTPQNSPREELAEFADKTGMHFSRFIGEEDFFPAVVCSLQNRDRAAFYAYCVVCCDSLESVGDLTKSPLADRFYSFADSVVGDPALLKSLDNRPVEDYLNPVKNSKIYKAVAAYFGL